MQGNVTEKRPVLFTFEKTPQLTSIASYNPSQNILGQL